MIQDQDVENALLSMKKNPKLELHHIGIGTIYWDRCKNLHLQQLLRCWQMPA